MGGPNLILLILRILPYPNLSHISQWSKFPDEYDQCHAEGRGNGRQGTAAPWPQWAYSSLPGPAPGRGRGRGLEPGSLAPSGG